MKLMIKILLAVTLVVMGSQAVAQPMPEENHYKTYYVSDPYTFVSDIMLLDQFGVYFVNHLILDQFANPAEKNFEPLIFPEVHQTWWSLDLQGEGWIVEILNQFGPQVWRVMDPRYLVLPARKFEPGPPLMHNHYLAYEAVGDTLFWQVHLADQFGFGDVVVMEPMFFLNPVEKIVNGVPYPIIDPSSHLACYRIDPPVNFGLFVEAFDQFGIWPFIVNEHCMLCVPSLKLDVTTTEVKTWSDIKTLYHD